MRLDGCRQVPITQVCRSRMEKECCTQIKPLASHYIGPGPDECLPYEGSLIPDCQYFLNNKTSYYHIHEYS